MCLCVCSTTSLAAPTVWLRTVKAWTSPVRGNKHASKASSSSRTNPKIRKCSQHTSPKLQAHQAPGTFSHPITSWHPSIVVNSFQKDGSVAVLPGRLGHGYVHARVHGKSNHQFLSLYQPASIVEFSPFSHFLFKRNPPKLHWRSQNSNCLLPSR